MVKKLKVWTYREGEPPFVHEGPTHSIYGIEGFFIQEIERGNTSFSASHPGQAHVFFLPISVGNVVNHLYEPLVTYDRDQLMKTVNNYTHLIAHKYPFWNRTNGADHLILSCHDWVKLYPYIYVELNKKFISFMQFILLFTHIKNVSSHRLNINTIITKYRNLIDLFW